MSDNVCDYYRFENVIRSVGNTLEDAFIESSKDLENNNDVSNFCGNSNEEVVEIDDFERSNKKVNKFEESLLIPHGQDLVDSLFYSICFAVRFFKSDKSDWFDDSEIEEVLGPDLYNQLCDEKNFL